MTTEMLTVELKDPRAFKYSSLIDYFRGQVDRKELQPGDRAPSIAEMSKRFGISRGTIVKAYKALEMEGLLVREQGRGTFITQKGTEAEAREATGTIGLLIQTSDQTNPYIVSLINGIRQEVLRLNLEVLWLNETDPIQWEKVDGVVIYAGQEQVKAMRLPPGMPCVSVLRPIDGITSVVADDFEGGRLAVKHLLAQGHRHIAYMLSSNDDSFSRQRLAGYNDALREANIAVDPRRVTCLLAKQESGSPLATSAQEKGTMDYLGEAERTMREWLQKGWSDLNCSAIIAPNDPAAVGIVRALAEKGLSVPGDVSVVGFDGTEVSKYSSPRLTTVEVPVRDIGARGVFLLMEQIQEGWEKPHKAVLPVKLRVRESTAPLDNVHN
jgi:LacI family transcriptional regulator